MNRLADDTKQSLREAGIETALESSFTPVLSVAVITRKEDTEHLLRMIDSLPSGVEVAIVSTEKVNRAEDEGYFPSEEFEIVNDRLIKTAVWRYRKFSFAKARNHSIELCSSEWIIWMDSDDVLLHTHKAEFLSVVNLPAGVGGVEMNVCGYQPPYKEGERGAQYCIPHLRAFRKSSGALFGGFVHEQIAPQIIERQYKIVQSSILIAHLGYVCTVEEMTNKIERNVELLIAQLAFSDYSREYYLTMLKNQLFTLHDIKGLNDGWPNH